MLVNGEKMHINENENETDSKNNIFFESNVNDRKYRRAKLCSDNEAESGAERYIRLLKAPDCREFFLKVMYHLPYDTREYLLNKALKAGVEKPAHYFTYCAKRELVRLGF